MAKHGQCFFVNSLLLLSLISLLLSSNTLFIFLSLSPSGLNGQSLESIPSSPVLKKPGETLSLSCKISGYTVNSHFTHWIRQPAGKSLEWMGYSGLGLGYHAKRFEGRMETTKDNSNSMLTLKLSGLRAEDSAVYYCSINLFIFILVIYSGGTNTQLSYLSKNPKPPSIKIVRPSDSDLWGSNNGTLLSLVSGLFPSDVIVNWEKAGSRLPLSRYSSSPSVLYAGSSTYSMNSRLIVPRSEWNQNSNYSCAVRHESSKRPITSTIENVFGEWTVDLNSAMD
uniref:Ig-like domain-containing protein n=1 Tax=Oncorhynchus kisutch TaxID=8019 RepID=A0A8C7JIV3_ONCKI